MSCPCCQIHYDMGYSRGRTDMLLEDIDRDPERLKKILAPIKVDQEAIDRAASLMSVQQDWEDNEQAM